MALRETGAEVIAIAGNHDHAATFEAYRPLLGAAGIHARRRPAPGRRRRRRLVRRAVDRRTRQRRRAALPFPALRGRAPPSCSPGPRRTTSATYDQRVRDILEHLKTGFTAGRGQPRHGAPDGDRRRDGRRRARGAVHLRVPRAGDGVRRRPALRRARATCTGASRCPPPARCTTAGRRSPSTSASRTTRASCCLVEVTPTTPAKITEIPMTPGRRLRTVHGTVAELVGRAEEFGEDYLRVYVREATRAGLREEVQDALPNALEIRIDPEFAAPVDDGEPATDAVADRSPGELFAELLRGTHGRRQAGRRRCSRGCTTRSPADRAGCDMRPVLLEMTGFASFRDKTESASRTRTTSRSSGRPGPARAP